MDELLQCVKADDPKRLKKLLAQTPEAEAEPREDKISPLYLAAWHGRLQARELPFLRRPILRALQPRTARTGALRAAPPLTVCPRVRLSHLHPAPCSISALLCSAPRS